MPEHVARREAARALSEIDVLLDIEPVEGIFLWNGSGLVATAAVLLARRRGIATIFGENGYLPGTLQIDPEGVNQLASIAGEQSGVYAKLDPGPQVREAFLQARKEYISGLSPSCVPPHRRVRASLLSKFHERAADLLSRRQKIKWRRPANHGIPERLQTLPQRFVLLPLQIVKDSQLINHSPLVGKDMSLLVRKVREALRIADPSCRLVVKLHPAERRADYGTLARELGDVLFVTRQSVREFLPRAEAVVTVNSTVGFEALMYGKSVLMVGDNFYRVAGVVSALSSLQELPDRLVEVLQGVAEPKQVENYLANVFAHYFVKASWRDFSEDSLSNTAGRIEKIVEEYRSSLS
jgi:capsular polysaccharide export protein